MSTSSTLKHALELAAKVTGREDLIRQFNGAKDRPDLTLTGASVDPLQAGVDTCRVKSGHEECQGADVVVKNWSV